MLMPWKIDFPQPSAILAKWELIKEENTHQCVLKSFKRKVLRSEGRKIITQHERGY